jgi:hypothetical protein
LNGFQPSPSFGLRPICQCCPSKQKAREAKCLRD